MGDCRTLLLFCALAVGSALARNISGRAFDRFITIWLGQQDFADVVRDPHFAELQKHGILLSNYFAHSHPSQPNYIAALAGDYFGLNHDEPIRVPIKVSTLIDLLDWRDLSWKAYMEDLPGPGYLAAASDGKTGNGTWDYVRPHNPFVSFDSINLNGTRLLNIESFHDWNVDFAARKVPQYVFMSPNMMNNGRNSSLDYATEWARHFITPMLDDGAFAERTLILLTYDEAADQHGPNHVASLLLGSAIPTEKRGTQDDTFYTHYSMLSTFQHNWDLPHLGRYDVGASIYQLARGSGSSPGVEVGNPSNWGSVNNSKSYPGAYNNQSAKSVTIPPPNLGLKTAGGRGVLEHVEKLWGIHSEDESPYDGSGTLYDASHEPVYLPQMPLNLSDENEEDEGQGWSRLTDDIGRRLKTG